MTTRIERDRRLAVVEKAIHDHGWTLRVQTALAAQLGVTRRTVQKYKASLADEMRRELAEPRADVRANFLVRLRGHQLSAAARSRDGALASMLSLEADILGLKGQRDEVEPQPVRVELVGIPAWGALPSAAPERVSDVEAGRSDADDE